MSSFELNKIVGAVLGALVFVMGLSVLSDIIFAPEELESPAYQVAVADAPATEEEAPAEEDFAVLLASADPAAGERGARVCSGCHNFEEGGANGVGPALWGVVGRAIAGVDGYGYSPALTAHAEAAPTWDYAQLDGFLENPQGWVPGTIMGYAGIRDGQERANVIAYLRSVSPDAPPLPEPQAAPAEEQVAAADPAATAEGAAAAPAEGGTVDPFVQLVASADPSAGAAASVVCQACHSVEAGQPHKLGPNLHGVFNAPIAGKEDYDYSPAMRAYAEEARQWDIAHLDTYLEAPMEVVPGTKMAYAGVKDENQRAAIIAWLHSISPEAGPIEAAPQTAAAPATEDSAAADGGAAPAAEQAQAVPQAGGDTATRVEDAAAAPAATEVPASTSEGAAAAAESPQAPGNDATATLPAEASTTGLSGREEPSLENPAARRVAEEAAEEVNAAQTETGEEAGQAAPATTDAGEAPVSDTADATRQGDELDSLVAPGEAQSGNLNEFVNQGPGPAPQEGSDPVPAEAAQGNPTLGTVPQVSLPTPSAQDETVSDSDVETQVGAPGQMSEEVQQNRDARGVVDQRPAALRGDPEAREALRSASGAGAGTEQSASEQPNEVPIDANDPQTDPQGAATSPSEEDEAITGEGATPATEPLQPEGQRSEAPAETNTAAVTPAAGADAPAEAAVATEPAAAAPAAAASTGTASVEPAAAAPGASAPAEVAPAASASAETAAAPETEAAPAQTAAVAPQPEPAAPATAAAPAAAVEPEAAAPAASALPAPATETAPAQTAAVAAQPDAAPAPARSHVTIERAAPAQIEIINPQRPTN